MQENEFKAEVLNSEKDTVSVARNMGSFKAPDDHQTNDDRRDMDSYINEENLANTSEIKLVVNDSDKKKFFKDHSIDMKEVESPHKEKEPEPEQDDEEIIMKSENRNSLIFGLKGLNLYSYINLESKTSRRYWNTNVTFFKSD
jgi:hypothetical protein